MLNFISNSSAFVLKWSGLLYGRDKDSLSKVLMFVQSHAQTFLLSSTIFYHITCSKCDLCRVCSEFLKSVEWIRYYVPTKSIKLTYIIRAFYVHHNARKFNSSISKSNLVHCDHFMFDCQLKCTSDVSNYTTKVFFMTISDQDTVCLCLYSSYACPRSRASYITGVIMDIRHIFLRLCNATMWLILS